MGYGINKQVYDHTIDEVLVMYKVFTPTVALPLYYAHDQLYSPVALFSSGGTVLERYEYDAYGAVNILSPNYELRTMSSFGNPYTFTGRRADVLDGGTLNLMYYRARTYDPQTGRFMQRDPLGIDPAGDHQNPFKPMGQYKKGGNLYGYVKNGPLRYVDPWGTKSYTIGFLEDDLFFDDRIAKFNMEYCAVCEKTSQDHCCYSPVVTFNDILSWNYGDTGDIWGEPFGPRVHILGSTDSWITTTEKGCKEAKIVFQGGVIIDKFISIGAIDIALPPLLAIGEVYDFVMSQYDKNTVGAFKLTITIRCNKDGGVEYYPFLETDEKGILDYGWTPLWGEDNPANDWD